MSNGNGGFAEIAGLVSRDLVLRVLMPGALGAFLLASVWPEAVQAWFQLPIAGALGFLIIGFLSYAVYRGFYIALLSRFSSPQLQLTKSVIKQVTHQKHPWSVVRAVYISWRESVAKGDPRLEYLERVGPYVHAGYQSAFLFAIFGLLSISRVALQVTWGALLMISLVLGLASFAQDRELMQIERAMANASVSGLERYVREVFGRSLDGPPLTPPSG